MKDTKRILSLIIAVLLVVCAFSAIASAASVYNTGARHEPATSLSAQALAYYGAAHSYASLSGLAPATLKTTLGTLMESTLTNPVSYSSLTTHWAYTDAQNGVAGTQLFYSDATGETFNREHVWPQGRGYFSQSGAGCDLHHLRPTNAGVNNSRGDHTMGNVKAKGLSFNTATYVGKEVLWFVGGYSANDCNGLVEPLDDVKGDVARILLYVYTTYPENTNLFTKQSSGSIGSQTSNGEKVIESLETLLEWCLLDPPDAWEMGRNDMTQNIQGNRNVFIDYPEYAWLLFGLPVPDGLVSPSGSTGATPGPTRTPAPSPTPPESPGSDWVLTDLKDIGPGDSVVITMRTSSATYALPHNNGTTAAPTGIIKAVSDNRLVAAPDASLQWNVIPQGDGYTFCPYGTTGTWLYTTAANNGVRIGTDTNRAWTLDAASGYLKHTATGRFLGVLTDNPDWRAYTATTINIGGQTLGFYVKSTSAATPTPTPTPTPSPQPQRGDANEDGLVNAADAAAILRHLVRLTTLSPQGLLNAKVTDGTGQVSAADAAKILRYLVRLEKEL